MLYSNYSIATISIVKFCLAVMKKSANASKYAHTRSSGKEQEKQFMVAWYAAIAIRTLLN